MDEVNLILVLRDETGREWLAGAVMMPLVRFEDGRPAEELSVESLKDRAFTVHEFKVVDRGED